MPVAQVQRVVQQPLVVGAHIQGYRDHPARVDPGRGRVHGQLADRYLDAAYPPVADAQDLLGVGTHDQVHVAGAQLQGGEGLLDVVGPVDGQVDPPRPTVLVGVPLDRVADRGVIHDRQQLGQVIGQHLVVQHLVAVVQLLQVHVLGQVGRLPPQLLIDAPRLLLQGQHRRRQPPGQAEGLPFLLGERHPAVDERIVQGGRDGRGVSSVLGHGILILLQACEGFGFKFSRRSGIPHRCCLLPTIRQGRAAVCPAGAQPGYRLAGSHG